MAASFFEQPILNNPYEAPRFHHALDAEGQPLDAPPIEGRRRSELWTPVPKPRKKSAKTGRRACPSVNGSRSRNTIRPRSSTRSARSSKAGARPAQSRRLGRHADDAAAVDLLADHPFSGRPPVLLSDRGGRDGHLAHRGRAANSHASARYPRAPQGGQRRLQPRAVPPRAEDGDRRPAKRR